MQFVGKFSAMMKIQTQLPLRILNTNIVLYSNRKFKFLGTQTRVYFEVDTGVKISSDSLLFLNERIKQILISMCIFIFGDNTIPLCLFIQFYFQVFLPADFKLQFKLRKYAKILIFFKNITLTNFLSLGFGNILESMNKYLCFLQVE